MEQTDKKRFAELLNDVMSFYKQDISHFALNIWWEACNGFSYEQVSKALTRHAMDPEKGQFVPKVADIVRVLDGTPTDKAHLAWGKAFNAISRVGPWQDVVFDDAAIHATIEDMGGWVKFCNMKEDEVSFSQSRFVKSYAAYAKQEKFEYTKRLHGAGSPESFYLEKGLEPPKPRIVGDIDKARLVYKEGGRDETKQISFENLIKRIEG